MAQSTGIESDASDPSPDQNWRVRIFGSKEYSSLWFAQVIGALGDWVGLFAITALASTISGEPEAATALVLTARVAPSFFLGPFMGVLVDRYDRKILMRIADIARALIFVVLPFVQTLWGLIVASLLLEIFTLMWSPAKESLVPRLVPKEKLTNANSLGVLAAYATMPLAGVVQFFLKQGSDALAGVSWLHPLQFDRMIGDTQALAFYFDALTYLTTAFVVWRFIKTPGTPRLPTEGEAEGEAAEEQRRGFKETIQEIREGWRYIFVNPVVRAVNVGLGAGLLGGAMLVPLGPAFAKLVLGDPNAFSLFITALGFGVALGVAALTALQQRLPKAGFFVAAIFFCGVSVLFAVSVSTFWLSAVGVFGLGLGAGAVYVLGFTMLQEATDDELRGRIFTTFLTLVRLCVLGAMVFGPALSAMLDPLMHRIVNGTVGEYDVPAITLFGTSYAVPGVRVALWIGGAGILGASVLASRSLAIGFRANLRSIGGEIRSGGGNGGSAVDGPPGLDVPPGVDGSASVDDPPGVSRAPGPDAEVVEG